MSADRIKMSFLECLSDGRTARRSFFAAGCGRNRPSLHLYEAAQPWASLATRTQTCIVKPSRLWSSVAPYDLLTGADMNENTSFETSDEPALAESKRLLFAQLTAEGIRQQQVLAALARVPRERFVPRHLRASAYENRPLPIGHDQTISQPYIVALMTELCELEPGSRVLEVGTGSGYQTAVLSCLAQEVFTVEVVEELALTARETLTRVGFAENVSFRVGDGYLGWPEHAPFDAILVAAAPPSVPSHLARQLRIGGKLVIPVGVFDDQVLRVVTRTEQGLTQRDVVAVRFVPLVQSEEH